jgi:hypothetical protein
LSFSRSFGTIKLPSVTIDQGGRTSIPAATLLLAGSRNTSHSSRHRIGLLDNCHMASNKLTVVNDLSPPDIVFGVLYCLGPTCVCPLESAWVCETVSRTYPSVYDTMWTLGLTLINMWPKPWSNMMCASRFRLAIEPTKEELQAMAACCRSRVQNCRRFCRPFSNICSSDHCKNLVAHNQESLHLDDPLFHRAKLLVGNNNLPGDFIGRVSGPTTSA